MGISSGDDRSFHIPYVAPSDLVSRMVLPSQLTSFSEWQYQQFSADREHQRASRYAVEPNSENQTSCLGFGCHLDTKLACLRALTELC